MTKKETLEYQEKQLQHYKLERDRLKGTFDSCLIEAHLNPPAVLQLIQEQSTLADIIYDRALHQVACLKHEQMNYWNICARYNSEGIKYAWNEEDFETCIEGAE
jgi:hypothetical protein